ncbi:hypothetical protein [Haloechinothrix salitolerans]|uniref:Uncharacterized protein n=1 Tax=Haloechinothrix salitolerans TaxID=926830 RepID=A0ABW2BYF5_9PSEU
MSVASKLTPCTMLTRDGEPCGKPGDDTLPTGICVEHAIQVFRAVSRIVAAKTEEAKR